ncbi:MAG: ATP synthase subunit I [Syntrophobacterales bacterium]|nr:ATP synthase subunit I [Syntrophobacterales bacterium]
MDFLSPRTLKVGNWVILAALTALSRLMVGTEFAVGVAVGGVLAVLNFHALHRALNGLAARAQGQPPEQGGRAKAYFAVRQALRYIVVLAVIFYLVGSGRVHVLGLVVGLSTVVLTLMLAAVAETVKLKRKEAHPSHGTPHSVS